MSELELYNNAKKEIEKSIKKNEEQISFLKKLLTNDKEKLKLISSLIALTMSTTHASAIEINKPNNEVSNDISITNLDNSKSNEIDEISAKALKSIYQRQMEYLFPTINNLNELFDKEDKNNELKNTFDKINRIRNIDLNCYNVSLDGHGNYEYYIKSGSIPDEISKNDVIILDMYKEYINNIDNIKDKKIKDKFKKIIGKNINYAHSEIFTGEIARLMKNDEPYSDLLYTELLNVYNNQNNFILDTRKQLDKFYSKKQNEEFIKKHYNNAYTSYKKDVKTINNGNNLSKDELSNILIDEIINNNETIYNFRIKPTSSSARNTDYGMITDENGISRMKTNEDKQIIDEYSSNLEEYMYYVPSDLLNFYKFANENKYDKDNTQNHSK